MRSDKMRMIRSLATATCVVTFLAGIVLADAKSDYEMLFGKEAKKVSATKGTMDDTAFAAKVLKAAKAMGDDAKLQALLYEKACDFAMADPKGYPTVREAIKLLEHLVPDRQDEWRLRELKILEFSYMRSRGSAKKEAGGAYLEAMLTLADQADAADKPKVAYELYRRAYGVAGYLGSPRAPAIAARIKQINLRAMAAAKRESRFKKLAAAIAANPGDLKVRTELILFCLVELDEPAKAASLLATGVDQKVRDNVPLAAKKPADLTEKDCLELGDWYKQLAAKASAAGKPTALARAKTYYDRYLSLHTKRDMVRYKASAALAEVNKELKKLGLRAAPKSPRGKFLTLYLGKGVTMKLVRIPAGSFMMGSPKTEKGRRAEEGPQHKVTISKPLYMGVTEVTIAQFTTFVAATNFVTNAEKAGKATRWRDGGWKAIKGLSWRTPSYEQTPAHPVASLTWTEAQVFCKWLGEKTSRSVRLPTEAEWEYACRAGSKTRYYFGDDDKQLGDYAWYNGNSNGKAHPVAQKKPNAFGLYDMHGNITELCLDILDNEYYAKSKPVDPQGPTSGNRRIARGGTWWFDSRMARSACRGPYLGPNWPSRDGFRVVVAPRAAGR